MLCCNKTCEKKIHFCLVWDFPMTYQIKGGKWVILYSYSTVDSFYYEIVLVVTKPWLLYWLLNHKRVCCAQRTCAGWVYIFGGVKMLCCNKTCEKKYIFV